MSDTLSHALSTVSLRHSTDIYELKLTNIECEIPNIPFGDAVAGKDYYQTLSGLKTGLGTSKSVSFAALISYWYLKAFPIKEIESNIYLHHLHDI